MKKILPLFFYFFLFFGLFLSYPRTSSASISCSLQTGTYGTSYTGTAATGPGACQVAEEYLTVTLGCTSTGDWPPSQPCSTDPKTLITTCTCTVSGAGCPTYTTWTCPSPPVCTSSSYSATDDYCTYCTSSSCSTTTVNDCNYTNCTANSSSCGYTCDKPNLVVTAFTYPGGSACTTSANASVTIENDGPFSTGASFDVAVIRGASTADCTTDETVAATSPLRVSKVSTTALAAGASRTLTIPVDRNSSPGDYNAVVMADADCNITEGIETDNDRSDTYTLTTNISGNVYVDSNRNRVKDTGESNYTAGATVTLSGTATGTDITSTGGNYSFTALADGTYTVTLTLPSGYVITTTNPVTVSTGVCPTAVNFGIDVKKANLTVTAFTYPAGNACTLTANASVTVTNIGEIGTGTGFDVAVIRGRSTADSTTDETVSATNPSAVSKVRFSALAKDASATNSTISVTRPASPGDYTAVAMADADDEIIETVEGDNDRSDTYTLTTRIEGNVCVDTNGNGVKDTGEGNYSGATINLSGTATGTDTTNTGGNYSFTSLADGTYTVTLTLPSGYVATTTNPVTVSTGVCPTVVNFCIRQPPCQVTTNPATLNLVTGETGAVTASVTSGLGTAAVNSMAFGSYNTSIATVNPTSDASSPYSTTVTGIAVGSTAVWATATLNDGRTCQSSGTTDTDVNVTAPPTYPISGTVYVDTDGNGVWNSGAGEVAYTGAVTLTGGATASTGNYTIANNPDGTYSIALNPIPTGYTLTTANPRSVTVNGANVTGINFGIVRYSTLTINVYNDYNGNGSQDRPGDTGVSGKTVTITGATCSANTTYTTDIDGTRVFTNVLPGSCTVTVTPGSGWTSTTTNPRTVTLPPSQTVNFGIRQLCQVTTNPATLNLVTGGTGAVTASVTSGLGTATVNSMAFGAYDTSIATVNPTSDASSPYSTTATGVAVGSTAVWATATLNDGRTCQSTGTTDTDVNVTAPPTYPISGTVWVDSDGDGFWDSGEIGYDYTKYGKGAGALVSLSDAITASIRTDTDGTYSFQNLLAGRYDVTLSVPSGFVVTTTNPVLDKILPPARTVNFGIAPLSTVNIHVCNDFNGNGVQDGSDTDSSGRTVTVTGGGVGTYTTNASGNVALSNLLPNDSTITVTVPSGWTETTTNPRTVSYPPPTTQTVNFCLQPPPPPPPTVTGTASCSNGAATISTSWTSVQYSNGVYDFRHRRSTTTTWTYDYDAAEPKILTGLASNATYYVQVRGYTTSGHTSPTDWGSDTVTTADCDAPNLIISAFTYPDGYAGATGNASVTIKNTGETTVTNSFDVAVIRGASTASCTTDETVYNSNPPASYDRVSKLTVTNDLAKNATVTKTLTVNLNTNAGTYNAVAMADADCEIAETDESDNDRTDSYSVTANSITANVYQDLNGNGARDLPQDTGYSGARIVVSGPSPASGTTDANGQIIFSNILPGQSNIKLDPVPTGYTPTTSTSIDRTLPPPTTVNFGIQATPPNCTGLSANPTTVNPGQTSTLTTSGCPAGVTYEYFDDSSITGDSVTNNNTNTSTWSSPNPFWTDRYANPSVSVCFLTSGACSNYGLPNPGIHIVPLFSVSGVVFVDQNKDGIKNGTDANYTGGITISRNPAGGSVTYPNPAGSYLISNLPQGAYTISYNPPIGFEMTNPLNGPPATFSIRVGAGCTPSTYCDVNGNIANLNFGITNSIPWIQTTGGDPYFDGGISNPIPSGATCGPYMSLLGSGGTPGIVYIGNGSANFGSGQASQNPFNWIAGGLTYPEVYTPKKTELKTSYNTMYQTALTSGITPTPLGTSQCGAGGISNCALATTSLAKGVYIANGNLTLTGDSYSFPLGRDFVILVNGDLNINTEVHTPTGSFAFFSASGNINVASSVGETTITSTRTNIAGYYSADRSFYVQGINNCPTADRRLNVAGSIVVNAALGGGSFVNQRDLCAGDLQCPAFMVTERPDFILNAPDFIKSARRVWQEIAP